MDNSVWRICAKSLVGLAFLIVVLSALQSGQSSIELQSSAPVAPVSGS